MCAPHPLKDTSVDREDCISRACRIRKECDLAIQLAEVPEIARDIVTQPVEMPAPQSFPVVGILPMEGDGVEGGESSSPVSETSVTPEPAIRRVMIQILEYQKRNRWESFFVADGEIFDDVINTLTIIHDALHFHELVVPRLQPHRTALTVAKLPRWWRQAGMVAIIVSDMQEESGIFLEIARADDTVEDLLPARSETAAGGRLHAIYCPHCLGAWRSDSYAGTRG